MISKDRIIGMFLGDFIGDTFGKSVETWTPEKIKEIYGRLTEIVDPSHHKWFKNHKKGVWTDDCQLTIAVAKGLINHGLDMAGQKIVHIEAYRDSTDGWGGSTREAVRRLANGRSWEKSGTSMANVGKGTGAGNGVPMKVSPAGAYLALQRGKIDEAYGQVTDFVIKLSKMTHWSSISASASLAIMTAVDYCLNVSAETFHPQDFCERVGDASEIGRIVLPETITDDITNRLDLLYEYNDYTPERIISEFGGGHCYCYFSIPFTLMFFLKDYTSIEALYNVVNAGGDTDSNGSMVGAMLGALHGPDVFPASMIEALDADQKKIVLDTAEAFYEKFGK